MIDRKLDAAAEWHWAVLALVCGMFISLAALAAARGSWIAVAIALIGLSIFGKSGWRKYRGRRAGVVPGQPSDGEAAANALSARVVLLVIALGLLHPVYVLGPSGRLTGEDLGVLWPVFAMLWFIGVLGAGGVVFLYRYLAHHIARGVRDGRGDDV